MPLEPGGLHHRAQQAHHGASPPHPEVNGLVLQLLQPFNKVLLLLNLGSFVHLLLLKALLGEVT